MSLTLNKITNTLPKNSNPVLNKDRWFAGEISLEPEHSGGSYYLDFSNISCKWLKDTAKRFVLLQSATKTFSTCRAYLCSILRLDRYFLSVSNDFSPENINRKIMLDFIQYLLERKLSISTIKTDLTPF